MLKITTYSAKETKEIAYKIGKILTKGTLIVLTGDLGAGKTTFTQGLASGMGITKMVTSPTFTIMKVYKGKLPLYHIDAYRLEGMTQELGLEEMMDDDGVCVIEWPIFIFDSLPDAYLNVDIKRIRDDIRSLTFIPHGKEYEKILEVISL